MALRRVLKEFVLDRISAVDRPCQEGAVVAIMKRRPPDDFAGLVARISKDLIVGAGLASDGDRIEGMQDRLAGLRALLGKANGVTDVQDRLAKLRAGVAKMNPNHDPATGEFTSGDGGGGGSIWPHVPSNNERNTERDLATALKYRQALRSGGEPENSSDMRAAHGEVARLQEKLTQVRASREKQLRMVQESYEAHAAAAPPGSAEAELKRKANEAAAAAERLKQQARTAEAIRLQRERSQGNQQQRSGTSASGAAYGSSFFDRAKAAEEQLARDARLGLRASGQSFSSFRTALANTLSRLYNTTRLSTNIIGHAYGVTTSREYAKIGEHLQYIRDDVKSLRIHLNALPADAKALRKETKNQIKQLRGHLKAFHSYLSGLKKRAPDVDVIGKNLIVIPLRAEDIQDRQSHQGFHDAHAEIMQHLHECNAHDVLCPMFDALKHSMTTILANDELDDDQKKDEMRSATQDFMDAVLEEYPDAAQEMSETVGTSDGIAKLEDRVEILKLWSMAARLAAMEARNALGAGLRGGSKSFAERQVGRAVRRRVGQLARRTAGAAGLVALGHHYATRKK